MKADLKKPLSKKTNTKEILLRWTDKNRTTLGLYVIVALLMYFKLLKRLFLYFIKVDISDIIQQGYLPVIIEPCVYSTIVKN